MKVDVSEIKTFRDCNRKHQFSSRNRMHLRPMTPNDNLVFGTQFHECLAMMYLGTGLDKILEFVNREVTDSVYWKIMDNMVQGYYNGPYQQDKDRYVVIDIERSFVIPICCADGQEAVNYLPDGNGGYFATDAQGEVSEAICICGSIDMIAIDTEEGKLCGFEHKTTKNFRPVIYNLVDEQPRIYFWALKKILEDYHASGKYLEIDEVGCIYINEVRKLQTKFDYGRTPLKYKETSQEKFMKAFTADIMRIAHGDACLPQPGYMKCQMCDYASICLHFDYEDVDLENVMKEFEGEYEVREFDHLEEKVQRHADD